MHSSNGIEHCIK